MQRGETYKVEYNKTDNVRVL